MVDEVLLQFGGCQLRGHADEGQQEQDDGRGSIGSQEGPDPAQHGAAVDAARTDVADEIEGQTALPAAPFIDIVLGLNGQRLATEEVIQFPGHLGEAMGQAIGVTNQIDPGAVDVGLQEAAADRAVHAEALDVFARERLKSPRCLTGNQHMKVPLGDDKPVLLELSRARQVACCREQDGLAAQAEFLQ